MRKVFVALLCVLVLSLALTTPAFAGGDQVHGDKAQGEAYQNFETDNPPFDPNP